MALISSMFSFHRNHLNRDIYIASECLVPVPVSEKWMKEVGSPQLSIFSPEGGNNRIRLFKFINANIHLSIDWHLFQGKQDNIYDLFTCLPALLLCKFMIFRSRVWFFPLSAASAKALDTAIPYRTLSEHPFQLNWSVLFKALKSQPHLSISP